MAEGKVEEKHKENDRESKEEETESSLNSNKNSNKNANELLKDGGQSFKDMPFDRIVHIIREGIGMARIAAVQYLRKSLDKLHDDIISSGVVSDLVDCMKEEEEVDLQFEAAWALTNIASGTNDDTKAVVEGGAIPRFVQLIESPSDKVREQVIWALGNIVGDGPQGRDLAFDYGIVISLSSIVGNVHDSVIVRRQASWVFSNLCRHKALPLSDLIFNNMLPVFCKALEKEDDERCLHEICWGVSYITDNCTDMRMQTILNSTIYPHIVEILRRYNTKEIVTPAVRAIGNLSTFNDDQTQKIIELGALPILYSLLNHEAETIRKEVCWTFSNIAAGTLEQKEAIKDEGVITKVIEFLNDSGESLKVRKESLWVLCNLCDGATHDMARYLVNQGALQSLCICVDFADNQFIQISVEALDNLLKKGEEKKVQDKLPYNPFLMNNMIPREKLEEMLRRDNFEIKRRVESLIDMCYPKEEEEERRDDLDLMNEDINSNMR